MALKTEKVVPPVRSEEDDTVLLELAMYAHYTWGGVTYDRDNAYKFKREDAIALLNERDHDRPIWKMFTPPKVKQPVRMPIVDSTEVRATRTRTSLEDAALRGDRGATNTGKRIEVGTEDELDDILNRPDASGDVTV